MADWDADNFEPEEPIKKAAALDKWEGEDEDEDVKDNWDDEDEDDEKKAEVKKTEKLSEKIKEKENRLKKKQQELKEQELMHEKTELTPEEQLEEKLRVKKLQEDADLELAKDAFGKTESPFRLQLMIYCVSSTSNSVTGIDAMCPSSKEDFTEFEKLLKEKISQFEKSVHYSSFLDSLFRELCISLEVDDLKKISNSLSVLLSEKQKQEKQNKGKKKKKGVLPGGGLKAQLRDDLDYAEFDGGYAQDYEDFM
ncbi:hypothetical protein INR49_004050 [Caranx melampygus]|nr:hypothetical protein INR49_004050 [Caranx melampygus]